MNKLDTSKDKPLFRGVCASSITPFNTDGTFALARLKPHIDWLIAEGVSAISPLGSSGEFAGMETDDRKRVMEASIEACAGRVPIVAGTHHVSTRLTQHDRPCGRRPIAPGASSARRVPRNPRHTAPRPRLCGPNQALNELYSNP